VARRVEARPGAGPQGVEIVPAGHPHGRRVQRGGRREEERGKTDGQAEQPEARHDLPPFSIRINISPHFFASSTARLKPGVTVGRDLPPPDLGALRDGKVAAIHSTRAFEIRVGLVDLFR